MRSTLVFVFLLMITICYGQQKIDVVHYNFSIALNDNNDSIDAEAIIRFVALEDSKTTSFDLASVNDKRKGMQMAGLSSYALTSRASAASKHIDAKHEKNKFTIEWDKPLKKGDTTVVSIKYKGIPADGLIISKTKYGRRSFFADNWPNRGHNWLACNDDPADKATVDFEIMAPAHYQVVANGVLKEETNEANGMKLTHWKEDTPISTKVMVIGVADFAVQLSGVVNNCIPVYSWVYPENKDKGFHDYAMALDILPFFIKNVGPYGYKKLANVQSKTMFGGLENANTIFYAESSVKGDRSAESLVTHEIAHQWFGNMATEKTFAHLWLSEGFATYMTILYFESKYGKDTATKMLLKDREEVIDFAASSNRSVVDTTKNYMELLNPNSYQKGGWVLHMLRRQLGDDIFWKSIRSYYEQYGGKTADTDDLRRVFEKVSGKNLETFFKQWLYTPGIPKLKIEWKYVAASKKVELTIEQMQDHVFEFPLELSFGKPGESFVLNKKIEVKQKKQQFSLDVNTDYKLQYLDPSTSLLFTATVKQVN